MAQKIGYHIWMAPYNQTNQNIGTKTNSETNTVGQCGDPGEDVSVIADRYFEKLGSIADQGPQARGLQ